MAKSTRSLTLLLALVLFCSGCLDGAVDVDWADIDVLDIPSIPIDTSGGVDQSQPDLGGDTAPDSWQDQGSDIGQDQGAQDQQDTPSDTPIDMGPPPNEGWIGAPCASAADCWYEDAVCLQAHSGWPGGMCTMACTRLCPDQDGDYAETFCVSRPEDSPFMADGQCVSQCDATLFPGSGCRDGHECQSLPRHNEPGTSASVCLLKGSGTPLGDCLEELTARGAQWQSWSHTTTSPSGHPGLVCEVRDPIVLRSPVNGVTLRSPWSDTPHDLQMSCDLALAIWDLTEVLKEYDVVEILDGGTYNCRTIAGTSSLSQHAYGLALDIYALVDRDGVEYHVENHWEHDTSSPNSFRAQLLYEVANRMHDDQIFNTVLTPNYNAAHDDHFHVDVKYDGGYFMEWMPRDGCFHPDF